MKEYIARKTFIGKNLLGKEITIPDGTFVDELYSHLYFEGVPFATTFSEVAHTYFVWAADGNYEARMELENDIIFKNRIRIWEEQMIVPTDPPEIKKITRTGRYTPEERAYIREHFPKLLDEDTFRFNDYFYRESKIEELLKLANYLNR